MACDGLLGSEVIGKYTAGMATLSVVAVDHSARGTLPVPPVFFFVTLCIALGLAKKVIVDSGHVDN